MECSSEKNFELKPILKLGKDHFLHKSCNFNRYITVNIAFCDFLPKKYDNLNDTLKINLEDKVMKMESTKTALNHTLKEIYIFM